MLIHLIYNYFIIKINNIIIINLAETSNKFVYLIFNFISCIIQPSLAKINIISYVIQ